MSKTVLLQGMCYAGKTTLGKMLGKALGLEVLDSRDIFVNKYGISEIEYLSKYGREKFIDAERKSLLQDFPDMVISVGGSAVYYHETMLLLKEKYKIVWLNVPLASIKKRKEAEGKERPIVYPDGINSFDELYAQRAALYPRYSTHSVTVTETDKPQDVINKILKELNN